MADELQNEVEDLLSDLDVANKENGRDTAGDIKKPPKINPVLKSPEKSRLFNIGVVLGEALTKVFDKNKKDTFEETARTPAAQAQQQMLKQEQEAKKPLKLPALATLTLGITAFSEWLADFLGPVGQFISKTLPKLFRPMSKIAGGFFKAIKGGKLLGTLTKIGGTFGGKLLKFGRFIPFLGSLFNFGFAIARFRKGEIIPGIFELVSGILNLTGVGSIPSMLIDGALLLYDLNKDKKKDESMPPGGTGESWWESIYNWAMDTPVMKWFVSVGKGIGAVFTGNWEEAGKQFDKAFPFIGWVINWVYEAGKSTGDFLEQAGINFGSPSEFFSSLVDAFVDVFRNMLDSIYDWLTGAADWVIDGVKDLGKGAWEGVKAVGSFLNPFDDVVIKGDKIVPISKDDDIVAAKKGGILDNIFNTITTTMRSAGQAMGEEKSILGKAIAGVTDIGKNVFGGIGNMAQDFMGVDQIVGELKASNQYLNQLVRLTAQLVEGQGQTAAQPNIVMSPSNNDMSGGMEGQRYTDGRYDYTNSGYHIG